MPSAPSLLPLKQGLSNSILCDKPPCLTPPNTNHFIQSWTYKENAGGNNLWQCSIASQSAGLSEGLVFLHNNNTINSGWPSLVHYTHSPCAKPHPLSHVTSNKNHPLPLNLGYFYAGIFLKKRSSDFTKASPNWPQQKTSISTKEILTSELNTKDVKPWLTNSPLCYLQTEAE